MVTGLFDTNILIDYLNGIEQAREEMRRFADKAISLVTWMDVMVVQSARPTPRSGDSWPHSTILPSTAP